ncbi:hypothetical protein [Phenylobacterium sp. J367]|uniref:hypothetical protein n=1 Tax=Phenylobacterium sp. J367 TaxID=2898435 RepID=UPI0021510543|nr:hypothetical protein [Phenylobacterium sp. J367]MCR5877082.1 hypothetical protein [Phenylobacterium sp. J367]
MPQPLKKPLKQLTFNSLGLADWPELTLRLTAVLNEWNKLEGTLGVLLGTLLNTRYSVAVATLASVVNFTARLELIAAAASAARPDFAEEVGALMSRLRSRAGERNKVIHGCWATSKEWPHHLIYCPTEAIAFAAARQAEGADPTYSILAAIKPQLRLWSARCFQDLEERIGVENRSVIELNNRIAQTPFAPHEADRAQ